jgi:hypothetical protein
MWEKYDDEHEQDSHWESQITRTVLDCLGILCRVIYDVNSRDSAVEFPGKSDLIP